jgi:hypothetical protein
VVATSFIAGSLSPESVPDTSCAWPRGGFEMAQIIAVLPAGWRFRYLTAAFPAPPAPRRAMAIRQREMDGIAIGEFEHFFAGAARPAAPDADGAAFPLAVCEVPKALIATLDVLDV